MSTVDVFTTQKENHKIEREEKLRLYKEKVAIRDSSDFHDFTLSDTEDNISNDNYSDDDFKVKEKKSKKIIASKKKLTPLITPELAVVLDRTKVSDRQATFIIGTTIKSLGHDINYFACSRSTIKLQREKARQEMASFIKESFTLKSKLTVHWDGKMISNLTSRDHVDRLPILISGGEQDKLLNIKKLSSSTGEVQAQAVFDCLSDQEWDLSQNIVAMCFDTTSSNTGKNKGSCILLERKLGKNLFWLACRHHIFELLIGAAFQAVLPLATSGPDNRLFVRFQSYWSEINQSTYITANPTIILRITDEKRNDIVNFCQEMLQIKQVRDDYRELLELSIIFLGKEPIRGIRFMTPGATSHARWMSKVIYCLKIFMFSEQFNLNQKEKRGLEEICVFIVTIYIKNWFTAAFATCAPNNDLQLMKTSINYDNLDISNATVKKMMGHLWYLSDELVGLCLFDQNVSVDTKRKIVHAMINNPSPEVRDVRPNIKKDNLKELGLHDLANKNTMRIFIEFGVDNFWESDVVNWNESKSFKEAENVFKNLRVTNDVAERGVALIQDLNRKITHDEDQLQFLLQVVSEHRKNYPDCSKNALKNTNSTFML